MHDVAADLRSHPVQIVKLAVHIGNHCVESQVMVHGKEGGELIASCLQAHNHFVPWSFACGILLLFDGFWSRKKQES